MQEKRLYARGGAHPQDDRRPLTLCLRLHGGRLRAERGGGALAEIPTRCPSQNAAGPAAGAFSLHACREFCMQGVRSLGKPPLAASDYLRPSQSTWPRLHWGKARR